MRSSHLLRSLTLDTAAKNSPEHTQLLADANLIKAQPDQPAQTAGNELNLQDAYSPTASVDSAPVAAGWLSLEFCSIDCSAQLPGARGDPICQNNKPGLI